MIPVLIVDDEQPMRTYLTNLIDWAAHGFCIVGTAANGRQALALQREHHPDIVMTDIRMPVIDGLSLTQQLLMDPHPPYIILLTAFADSRYAIEALNAGVSKYLLKHELNAERLLTVLDQAKLTLQKRGERVQMPTAAYSKVVSEAVAIAQREYDKPLHMSDVAERLLVSANHFSFLFRKETGQSYVKYLNNVRVDHAKRLLATTLLKHYEVCERVGFESYPYFSTLFKRETGLNPAQYRKRYNAQALGELTDE